MGNVSVQVQPIRKPLILSPQAVIVPFLLRLTNQDDKNRIRVRDAIVDVTTKRWKYSFPVVRSLRNQVIDVTLKPLSDSGWILVHTEMPLTSQTLFGMIHPENTKVQLRLERVGGLLRQAKCMIPSSQWWDSVVMPTYEAAGGDNDNDKPAD